MAIRPCPSTSGSTSAAVTGLARWQCDLATGEWSPAHGPDLGDCKSAELTRLEVAARSEDPGMNEIDGFSVFRSIMI